jgi:hypothetical protein
LIVNINAFRTILQKASSSVNYNWDQNIKYEKVIVRLIPILSTPDRQDTINGLRNLLDPNFSLITDVRDTIASTGTASNVIIGFFNIVSVICILLCFFTLSVSFESNVRENRLIFN